MTILPDIPKLNDEGWLRVGYGHNPIHFEKGAWFYWDETWTNLSRPFNTYEEALIGLGKYLEYHRIHREGR